MGQHHDAVKAAVEAIYEIHAKHEQLERVARLLRDAVTAAYASGKEAAGGSPDLRDTFAAAVLPALLRAQVPSGMDPKALMQRLAQVSYEYADAMVEARRQG